MSRLSSYHGPALDMSTNTFILLSITHAGCIRFLTAALRSGLAYIHGPALQMSTNNTYILPSATLAGCTCLFCSAVLRSGLSTSTTATLLDIHILPYSPAHSSAYLTSQTVTTTTCADQIRLLRCLVLFVASSSYGPPPYLTSLTVTTTTCAGQICLLRCLVLFATYSSYGSPAYLTSRTVILPGMPACFCFYLMSARLLQVNKYRRDRINIRDYPNEDYPLVRNGISKVRSRYSVRIYDERINSCGKDYPPERSGLSKVSRSRHSLRIYDERIDSYDKVVKNRTAACRNEVVSNSNPFDTTKAGREKENSVLVNDLAKSFMQMINFVMMCNTNHRYTLHMFELELCMLIFKPKYKMWLVQMRSLNSLVGKMQALGGDGRIDANKVRNLEGTNNPSTCPHTQVKAGRAFGYAGRAYIVTSMLPGTLHNHIWEGPLGMVAMARLEMELGITNKKSSIIVFVYIAIIVVVSGIVSDQVNNCLNNCLNSPKEAA